MPMRKLFTVCVVALSLGSGQVAVAADPNKPCRALEDRTFQAGSFSRIRLKIELENQTGEQWRVREGQKAKGPLTLVPGQETAVFYNRIWGGDGSKTYKKTFTMHPQLMKGGEQDYRCAFHFKKKYKGGVHAYPILVFDKGGCNTPAGLSERFSMNCKFRFNDSADRLLIKMVAKRVPQS